MSRAAGRIIQRLLALNASVWHNWINRRTRQAARDRLRSLTCPDSPVNDLGLPIS